ADNFSMFSRKAISVAVLVLLLPLCLWCPLPSGHGPSSVVHGPRCAFRAYRSSVQLRNSFTVKAAIKATPAVWLPPAELYFGGVSVVASLGASPKISALRC